MFKKKWKKKMFAFTLAVSLAFVNVLPGTCDMDSVQAASA